MESLVNIPFEPREQRLTLLLFSPTKFVCSLFGGSYMSKILIPKSLYPSSPLRTDFARFPFLVVPSQ